MALESIAEEVDNQFLKNGLNLAVEGQSADYIRDICQRKSMQWKSDILVVAAIFSQAGTYAPTLGVLGAVLGLIAALGNMADIEELRACHFSCLRCDVVRDLHRVCTLASIC